MTQAITSQAPQLTVVMPSYNASATILKSIASVQRQSVTDWELIVVDDGSSDNTLALVAELADEDPRIRVLQQANAGPSVARNHGVAEARAPIIAFLDSDDLWEPEHLALNLANLGDNPELGVSFSPCRLIDTDGRLTGEVTAAWQSGVTLADILSCNPSSTCSALVVRKSVFEASQGFSRDMVHAEDQEWLYRVLADGWAARGIAQPTVHYRLSPKGLSADTERMRQGWRMFIASAQERTPDIVAAQLPKAESSMSLYFARRLLRDGDLSSTMRQHLWNSLRSYPRIALEQPRMVVVLLASLLLPTSMIDYCLKLRGGCHA